MDCVTTPTGTLYSTPTVVQTVQQTITTGTTLAVTNALITTLGVPISIETQYGSSCLPVTASSTSTSATQDSTAPAHRKTNVGAVIGEAIAGIVALAIIIFSSTNAVVKVEEEKRAEVKETMEERKR
ncbi:hypothetical protein FS837_004672, partial [Tulasnella sp. UAMH 9824]